MNQPNTLLMIRHAEKPAGDTVGVDENGNPNPDGLIPQGWERAGALVALFAPNGRTVSSTLPSPGALVSPKYPELGHRPYYTLLPLKQRLGPTIQIQSDYPVDAHPKDISRSLLAMDAAVVLVCWEHQHLVNIAAAVAVAAPVANHGDVPTSWPGDRFDVIWRFDLNAQSREWTFSSIDQRLLAGDL